MPSTWRVHVIAERLRLHGITAAVRQADVYELSTDERHALVDALVAGQDAYPMVMVDGKVACAGGIDLEAIVGAATAVPTDSPTPGGCDCGGGCC
jgi:disulfide oxidoreductase YuzD